MSIEEQFFTDILGSDRFLSEIMDEIKEWVVNSQYAGLTTVDDFTEGAMNYFLLYISGLIKFDLELFADELIRLAFPNTSAGDFLNRIYARNGIYRKEGEYATTIVRFDLEEPLESDVILEAGSEVGTDEAIIYNLLEDVKIPKGETRVYGKVECQDVGIIGNVLAGTIINVFTELNFKISVINENDVKTGIDSESDDDFRARARDQAINGVSTGTDLWVEKVAETLVDDALCYDLESDVKLVVYKPTPNVVKSDLEKLFQRKEYRTRNTVIVKEADPVAVIGEGMNINLLLEDGAVSTTMINLARNRVVNYVNQIKLGGIFKPICIKQQCSINKVSYVELEGYETIDLTNNQYAVIDGELNITTEYKD